MKGDRQKKAAADLVTREYTANRNRRFTVPPSRSARRAPRAVRELRKFRSRRWPARLEGRTSAWSSKPDGRNIEAVVYARNEDLACNIRFLFFLFSFFLYHPPTPSRI